MTPTLTAQELHSIVERLPRKWWPEGLFWETHPDGFMLEGRYIPDSHAYLIFVGHVLQVLIGEGYHRFEWDSGETDSIDPSLSLCNHGDSFFGKSILEHLVSAACFAEKEADRAA